MMSRQVGRSKMIGKQTRSARQRRTQSMSHRGTQTQKLPHASVRADAMTSRRQENGKNQLHGGSTGKKPSREQSVSSTSTVAYGTG